MKLKQRLILAPVLFFLFLLTKPLWFDSSDDKPWDGRRKYTGSLVRRGDAEPPYHGPFVNPASVLPNQKIPLDPNARQYPIRPNPVAPDQQKINPPVNQPLPPVNRPQVPVEPPRPPQLPVQNKPLVQPVRPVEPVAPKVVVHEPRLPQPKKPDPPKVAPPKPVTQKPPQVRAFRIYRKFQGGFFDWFRKSVTPLYSN